jgi:hypothetical protein
MRAAKVRVISSETVMVLSCKQPWQAHVIAGHVAFQSVHSATRAPPQRNSCCIPCHHSQMGTRALFPIRFAASL